MKNSHKPLHHRTLMHKENNIIRIKLPHREVILEGSLAFNEKMLGLILSKDYSKGRTH